MIVLFVIKIRGQQVFACPANSLNPEIVGVTGTIAYAYAFQSEASADEFAARVELYNPLLKDYEIKRVIELTA